MKYQITCDNCGKQFLVDAETGQTVSCTCPGCGGTMQFTLPLSSYPDTEIPNVQPHTSQTNHRQRPKRKSVNPIMVGVTIGLSVLVVLAIILFVASHYGNKPVEPETSGYVVDTIATAPDYELVDEPLPETDAMQTDSLEQEQKTEPDADVEPVLEEVEPVEADTTAL